jgi:hypothetical protein
MVDVIDFWLLLQHSTSMHLIEQDPLDTLVFGPHKTINLRNNLDHVLLCIKHVKIKANEIEFGVRNDVKPVP